MLIPETDTPMIATMKLVPNDPVACFLALLGDNEREAGARRPLLTDAGIAYLERLVQVLRSRPHGPSTMRPRWDMSWRRLYLGKRLIKEYRQPAPLQTAVLGAFELKGWPMEPITNPLAREDHEPEVEARRRLHETVKNLNRGMPTNTLRFRQNKNMVLCEWFPSKGSDA